MRCSYCGTENPDEHRFCGMCGKALPEPTAELEAPDEPSPSRRSAPTSPASAYTGGILNLGAPAEPPSRNLDYLLEDDEPKSHKGWMLLLVVALALVGGLGWLRWRRDGLPLVGSLAQPKPSAPAATPSTDSSATSATSSAAPAPSNSPIPTSQPAANPSSPAPATSDAQSPPPTAAPSSAPAASSPSPSTALPAATSGNDQPAASKPTSDSGSDSAATVITAPAQPKTPAGAVPAAEPASAPTPAAKPAARNPSPAPTPKPAAKAADPVAMGEQFLYGRNGVPQNCDRGLRYIKPAADQSNTKAMITMGALYATGHCLSRDLPTAYRYFALALRSDPENGPLRQNVDMVWKQMTAEERKQAIRLTQ